jgi:hypothetical protein
MTEVPETDEQARIAIFYGKGGVIGTSGYGLYRIYRERDNMSVIDAYEKALLAIVGRGKSDA